MTRVSAKVSGPSPQTVFVQMRPCHHKQPVRKGSAQLAVEFEDWAVNVHQLTRQLPERQSKGGAPCRPLPCNRRGARTLADGQWVWVRKSVTLQSSSSLRARGESDSGRQGFSCLCAQQKRSRKLRRSERRMRRSEQRMGKESAKCEQNVGTDEQTRARMSNE